MSAQQPVHQVHQHEGWNEFVAGAVRLSIEGDQPAALVVGCYLFALEEPGDVAALRDLAAVLGDPRVARLIDCG